MNLDALSLSILVPAFLAGLLVLSTHVPMGMQVLSRSIVFIDLAIAQIATLGVIAADRMGFEPEGWVAQVAAVSAALLGALLLTWMERRWPDVQEALIGVLFVLAASGGMLLVANNPHGGEHLRDLLAGQILWVSTAQLLPVAVLAAIILALWFGLRDRLGRFGFYGLFAFAVTTSVQLVGVYLVFASLIVPALACRLYSSRIRLAVGYAVGAAGYILGLGLSVLFDLPSGAVVVWTLALVGIAIYSLGPSPSRSIAK
ncbi:zinc/manganese transporter permease [Sulfuricella sp. T08]|uniref:metal ABC transporter permease n=1 Tax=Sulfuricella sp. T08 TaxID=1632857 RepID=UPI00061795E3|nr:metal ABC transporter permease [Sulfuricella sp. T08]GAO37210.1 zinc/manganese transporter permease [Sulfuricella sp. T08]